MKWSFEKLQEYTKVPFETEGTLDLRSTLKERYPDEIIDASLFKVKVSAETSDGDVIVDADIKGDVTVPSSRSLKPVKLPLNFHITEVYVNSKAALHRYDDDVVALLVGDDGIIDFDKAVADNIIIQIPMQVLSPEEKAGKNWPNGNDWEVISESNFDKQKEKDKKVDPRLAKLKDFYSSNNDETK